MVTTSMKVDFHQNFNHFYHAFEILSSQEIPQDYMSFQSSVKDGAIHRLSLVRIWKWSFLIIHFIKSIEWICLQPNQW